jgi:hypothetical protein
MTDIVDILADWDKSLADMDKGESDWGIMTQIRFEQRDKICSALREIKQLRTDNAQLKFALEQSEAKFLPPNVKLRGAL